MYCCEKCDEVFSADDVVCKRTDEVLYWLDDRPVASFYEWFCPYCGSDEIVEAEYCEECGEAFPPRELEDGLCETCRVKGEPPCGANT